MKAKAKLSEALIQETLNGISEGLKPMKDFDHSTLSKEERKDLIQQLDELEALALEIKARL